MSRRIEISAEFIGKRIDSAISELIDDISRTTLQKLIKNEKVLINGRILNTPSQKITQQCSIDIIDSEITPDYDIIPENIDLDILYEDEYIIVINKPAGLVCHPAPGHKTGTLVNAIVYHFKNNLSNINGILRTGIVHRLDKDTSGVMLIAKTNEAHMAFAELFANEKGKSIKRKYICYVFGSPKEKQGKIETFINRHPKNRQIYTVSENSGKIAITLYNTKQVKYITSTKCISKVGCELLTGRTHQIRVHMKYMGNPIIGDQTYGKSKIESFYPDIIRNFSRQALHSKELFFIHPFFKKEMNFIAEESEDLKNLNILFNL